MSEVELKSGWKVVKGFLAILLVGGVLSAAGGTYLYINWEKHFPPIAELQEEVKEARRVWQAEKEAEEDLEKRGVTEWVDSLDEQYTAKAGEMINEVRAASKAHNNQIKSQFDAAEGVAEAGVAPPAATVPDEFDPWQAIDKELQSEAAQLAKAARNGALGAPSSLPGQSPAPAPAPGPGTGTGTVRPAPRPAPVAARPDPIPVRPTAGARPPGTKTIAGPAIAPRPKKNVESLKHGGTIEKMDEDWLPPGVTRSK